MEEELKLLGLSDIDVKVYILLLKLGESSASEIAKKGEIPRASIYDILERLEKEGLVSYIIKNLKKYFSATEPKTIVEDLESKKKRIEKIIPDLEKVKKTFSEEKITTEVYEGQRGVQTILNLVLDSKELFVVGASRKSMDVLPYFMERWHKERIKKKIKVKIIYNDEEEIREQIKSQMIKKTLGVGSGWEYKFLDKYISPLMTVVFGNKVALIMWKKENPSAILIKNSEVAETYKQYILDLWKIAKK